jgi:hypothetical protein
MGMPRASMAEMTPTWASPSTPPPSSTRAMVAGPGRRPDLGETVASSAGKRRGKRQQKNMKVEAKVDRNISVILPQKALYNSLLSGWHKATVVHLRGP